MTTFENCPRKFAFRYIERPPIADQQSIEAFMGKAAHDVLETLYQTVQMERTPKWEEIRDLYESYWDKNWTADILIVRKEFTARDYRNVGRRCLQDYFVKHYPFRATRTLGLEERITLDLDGTGAYRLQGFIDRLAEAEDGTIEIHDYKTSRRLPSQEEVDRDRQLALYQLGIEKRWDGVRKVRLMWHYLRSGRTLVSIRTPESLEELRLATMQLIDKITVTVEKGDLPPHETMLCDWCEYQPLCPAKRHLFATAAMTPKEFKDDDGVKLVDRFAAAARKKQEVDVELKTVRQEIIDFATAKNLTRVAGHNASVGISRRVDVSIPRQNTPERAQLDAVVLGSGRWQDVSDLSRSKLPKALQTDLFDPATRERVAALLQKSEIITVTKRMLTREGADEVPDVG